MQDDGFNTFFEPQGVALVGARRFAGFGYGIPIVLKRHGWADRLYLVNPAGGELHGMKVYERIADVPDPVDLAVVIVPAKVVPEILEEVGARGIRHVIVESAGFAEIGEAGRELQDKALEAARRNGIRVIGPNCVGVVSAANRFTTVEVIDEALEPGSTGIIAQSGVFGNVLLDLLPEYRLPISKAVTLGNRMDVNECDVLRFMRGDPATKVILMYLEGAADGSLLRETLEEVTREKPVMVLKSGRTEAGRKATASHTASLSGVDNIYEGLFEQTGAIRVRNLEELVELARVFSTQPLPKGNRLAILTSSGSLGVIATDAAVSGGLVMPPLSDSTVERVLKEAPAWMNVKNPLDIGPSPQYEMALNALMEDPEIDMVLEIVIIPFAIFRELTRRGYSGTGWFGDIVSVRRRGLEKPLVVCAVGHGEFVNAVREVTGPDIPVFGSPEPAAGALAALYRYSLWRKGLGG